MKKVLIIYTSMTGNTEALVEEVQLGLKENNVIVDIKEAFDARPDDLLEYDGFLIGTYTWEGGEIPDEFMFFYEELDSFDLTGKKAAVFGSGDSYYRFTFGAALNLFADKIQSCGATITVPTLLIDLFPEEEELDKCRQFAQQFSISL